MGMGWIIAGGLMAVALLVLMLLPVRLSIALRQDGWQAQVRVEVRYAFLRFEKAIDITANVRTALEHMWKRWREKGKAVQPNLTESVSRVPRRKAVKAALPALRRLGRATRCHALRLQCEVGGSDAMESALLAGTVWGGAGILVGQFSRSVRVPESALKVSVAPNFQQPVWRLHADCILAVRLGKALMEIIWLLRQELSRKEIIAWARDSLLRKGDQTNGRAPDPRPDEDGHGEP